MYAIDTLVVGAGAIGLACAAEQAKLGKQVLVVEQSARLGDGISSRSSEVVHSGLYYPTGSLKHLLCTRGRELMYAFFDAFNISHRKCGKLVVASTPSEMSKLQNLHQRGVENGLEGIKFLDSAQIKRIEPEIVALGGLHVPQTGIFDSTEYISTLASIVESHDGIIALRTPFLLAESSSDGFLVKLGGTEPVTVFARHLVNAAGLFAPQVAERIIGLDKQSIPKYRFAKGSYFRLTGPSPFSRLVYPIPVEGGLGIHATLDLNGNTRFGPDVEWLPANTEAKTVNYAVSPTSIDSFHASIQRYWPAAQRSRLQADYAGCRPKLYGPSKPAADFLLQGPELHRLRGLVNLYGIESPGLTSSLALGESVAAILA